LQAFCRISFFTMGFFIRIFATRIDGTAHETAGVDGQMPEEQLYAVS
jgi:hypothetical protein